MTKTILINLLTLIVLLLSPVVKAEGGTATITQPPGFGVPAPFQQGDTPNAENLLETILLNVITLFYTIGGIGVVVYFVWGAVDWILSGGDKEKVASARKKMTHALIGLALLALSFVIINWVGLIVGFNPLGNLQIRGLGDNPSTGSPNVAN